VLIPNQVKTPSNAAPGVWTEAEKKAKEFFDSLEGFPEGSLRDGA
jgi:hypothetical protein